MATALTRFRHARMYLTFRCNSRCGYCNVWQDPVFDGHQELTSDGLRRCLDELAELGVTYLDITGGEPSLHRELVTAVRHARDLGMTVELTTNAIRFAPLAAEIVPLVDTLNISLDTLSAERYHRIRGTDTLDRTLALVEGLRADGADNLKLICVVTDQNVAELDSIVAHAQQHRVAVYLAPMFSYFAAQSDVRPPGAVRTLKLAAVDGRNGTAAAAEVPARVPSSLLLRRVAEQRYTPYTVVNLAFLHHLRTLDPATVTACGANSRILTIGPDGRVMLPCYHEWDASLAWERPYRELVRDPGLIRVRDEEVGHRPGCRSCAVFPYLGLPMSHRLTTPFLLQAFSRELDRLKPYAAHLTPERRKQLLERSEVLLAEVERASAPLRPGGHLDELYHFEVVDGLVRTGLAEEPVTPEELLADHVHDDCWRVQRAPHRIVRLLYAEILPALAADGPDTAALATDVLDVHLDCWRILLALLPGGGASETGARQRLAHWCARAAAALRGRRAASALALLGSLSTLPAVDIASWGSPRGHAEEPLTVKLLRSLTSPGRRAELAPLFSAEFVPALIGEPLPTAAPAAGPVPTPEDARAGRGLDRFVASLRHADTDTLRTALRRWKAAADPVTAADTERRLLLAELGAGAL
ncbi:radical SAM/SPASM domain-containing protein [Streptomyces cinerochromogenes]|uniref:Radical SAM/SPASM domain-containing protein n=1 Tax=Streptomyces cinerochromogenes TaxID=66422 RepID=A0ABW7BF77_9ACTN